MGVLKATIVLACLAAVAAIAYVEVFRPQREQQAALRAAATAKAEAEEQRQREALLAESRARSEAALRQIEENKKRLDSPRFSFDDAARMANEGRWVDVGNYGINWIHHYPKDPRPWYILGRAHEELGQLVRARDAYLKSLSLSRGEPVVTGALAGVLWRLREHEMISGYFEDAVRAHPDDAELRNAAAQWVARIATLQASKLDLERRQRAAELLARDREAWLRADAARGIVHIDCAADTPDFDSYFNCLRHQDEDFMKWRRAELGR